LSCCHAISMQFTYLVFWFVFIRICFACHVLFVTASMLMTAQRDSSCWNHMLAVSLLLLERWHVFCFARCHLFYVTLVCSYVCKMALLMKKAKRTHTSQQIFLFCLDGRVGDWISRTTVATKW
jgi:hypothetical protein